MTNSVSGTERKSSHSSFGESESHSVVSNSLRPHGLYSPWNSPGQKSGVGSLSLLQGIFPTQGSNPGLPHRRCNSLPAEPHGRNWNWYSPLNGNLAIPNKTYVFVLGPNIFTPKKLSWIIYTQNMQIHIYEIIYCDSIWNCEIQEITWMSTDRREVE